MKKKEIVKEVVKLMVSTGIYILVSGAASIVKPKEDLNLLNKLCVSAGTFALGIFVTDKVMSTWNKAWNIGEKEFAETFKNTSDNTSDPQ